MGYYAGILSRGLLSRGILPEGLLSRWILSKRDIIQGHCPGGYWLGVLSRGYCPGDVVREDNVRGGGYCPGGYCSRTHHCSKSQPGSLPFTLSLFLPLVYNMRRMDEAGGASRLERRVGRGCYGCHKEVQSYCFKEQYFGHFLRKIIVHWRFLHPQIDKNPSSKKYGNVGTKWRPYYYKFARLKIELNFKYSQIL